MSTKYSDIPKGIMAMFSGSALSSALTGGLHHTEAIEPAMPFGVFTMVSQTHLDLDIDRARIQVDLYSDSDDPGVVAALADLAIALFDGGYPASPAGGTIGFDLINLQTLREDRVWRVMMEYTLGIER